MDSTIYEHIQIFLGYIFLVYLQAMYNQNVRKLVRMKTCDLNEQEAILKSMGIVSVINIE